MPGPVDGLSRRKDLARALERACRYCAFSWSAVERILAAQAKPRSTMEALVIDARLKPHMPPPLESDPAVTKRVGALFARGGPLAGIEK